MQKLLPVTRNCCFALKKNKNSQNPKWKTSLAKIIRTDITAPASARALLCQVKALHQALRLTGASNHSCQQLLVLLVPKRSPRQGGDSRHVKYLQLELCVLTLTAACRALKQALVSSPLARAASLMCSSALLSGKQE